MPLFLAQTCPFLRLLVGAGLAYGYMAIWLYGCSLARLVLVWEASTKTPCLDSGIRTFLACTDDWSNQPLFSAAF
jgi:hypothetical protein